MTSSQFQNNGTSWGADLHTIEATETRTVFINIFSSHGGAGEPLYYSFEASQGGTPPEGNFSSVSTGTVDNIAGDITTTEIMPTTADSFANLYGSNIDSPGDEDWFRLEIDSPKDITFEIGTGLPALLSIYDETGALLHQVSTAGSLPDEIDFDFEAAGLYFLGVEFLNDAAGYYLLSADIIGFAGPDDDYVNSSDTTGIVSNNNTVNGVLSAGGDTDWFKVSVTVGDVIELIIPDEVSADIIDADGNIITDRFGFVDFVGDQQHLYFADFTGDIFISVQGGSNQDLSYSLPVTVYSQDVATGVSTATTLSPSAAYLGELEYENDEDWLAFDVLANEAFRFELTDGFPQDFLIQLRGTDGETIQFTASKISSIINSLRRGGITYPLKAQRPLLGITRSP